MAYEQACVVAQCGRTGTLIRVGDLQVTLCRQHKQAFDDEYDAARERARLQRQRDHWPQPRPSAEPRAVDRFA